AQRHLRLRCTKIGGGVISNRKHSSAIQRSRRVEKPGTHRVSCSRTINAAVLWSVAIRNLMCGIAGIVKLGSTVCAASTLELMRDAVSYRGPDDSGSLYVRHGEVLATIDPGSSSWTVGLGHRRLSILDLSSSGHQPMCYEGRYWIVYNGEVYNYVELREELI